MPWDQGPGLRCPGARVPGIPSKSRLHYVSWSPETPQKSVSRCDLFLTTVVCFLWIDKTRHTGETCNLPVICRLQICSRYDERLKTKSEESTRLVYTGFLGGTGTPKDKDEVNRRDVCECDGWVCVFEVIGAPSRYVVEVQVDDWKIWKDARKKKILVN